MLCRRILQCLLITAAVYKCRKGLHALPASGTQLLHQMAKVPTSPCNFQLRMKRSSWVERFPSKSMPSGRLCIYRGRNIATSPMEAISTPRTGPAPESWNGEPPCQHDPVAEENRDWIRQEYNFCHHLNGTYPYGPSI